MVFRDKIRQEHLRLHFGRMWRAERHGHHVVFDNGIFDVEDPDLVADLLQVMLCGCRWVGVDWGGSCGGG